MAFIFHAQAVAQAEALLFQRAGNPQFALMLGNQAARQTLDSKNGSILLIANTWSP
jgi:hypothetical protein